MLKFVQNQNFKLILGVKEVYIFHKLLSGCRNLMFISSMVRTLVRFLYLCFHNTDVTLLKTLESEKVLSWSAFLNDLNPSQDQQQKTVTTDWMQKSVETLQSIFTLLFHSSLFPHQYFSTDYDAISDNSIILFKTHNKHEHAKTTTEHK
jgi:hypothetical protein